MYINPITSRIKGPALHLSSCLVGTLQSDLPVGRHVLFKRWHKKVSLFMASFTGLDKYQDGMR